MIPSRRSTASAFIRAVAAATVAAALIAGPAHSALGATRVPAAALPPIDRTKPAAIVAGTYISGADYADTVQRFRVVIAHQQQTPGQPAYSEAQVRSSAITLLVDAAVAEHYASRNHLTVSQGEIQKQFSATRAHFPTAKAFATALKDNGLTAGSYLKLLASQLLQQKVADRVAPAPASVEEVHARHILVASQALANSLYAQLRRDPGQFAALAKKYSTDKGSGAQGGDLGWFPRGAMVPPFEQAAFSLKVGQISPPVHSQFGYHIIQVQGHKQVPYAQAGQGAQQAVLQQRRLTFRTWLLAERARDHARVLVRGAAITP